MKPLPRFTAVIHCRTALQVLTQAKLALDNGADGLFLIDHARAHSFLLETYRIVRLDFPEAWVGLNFLDLEAVSAIEARPEGVDAIWLDDLGSLRMSVAASTPWRVFGGAAFKYQAAFESWAGSSGPDAHAAKHAARRMRVRDVITTSGPATGQPPTVEKLRAMTDEVPDRLFALASGVTAENVGAFLPYVDCFLVSTGISKSFHEFDAAKVRALADRIHSVTRPTAR